MKLTDEMVTMVKAQLGYIATVTEEGLPNIGPKRSLRLYGESSLIWNENTGKQILADVKRDGKVAVAFVNWGRNRGFRFVGTAVASTEGEAYDNCVEYAKSNGMGTPKAAVVVTIEEVYELQSGPNAGEKLL